MCLHVMVAILFVLTPKFCKGNFEKVVAADIWRVPEKTDILFRSKLLEDLVKADVCVGKGPVEGNDGCNADRTRRWHQQKIS